MNFRKDLEQIQNESRNKFLEEYKDYNDEEFLDKIVDEFLNYILSWIKKLKPEFLLTIKEIKFSKLIIKSSEVGRIYACEEPKAMSIPQIFIEIPNFAIDKVFVKIKNILIKEGYEVKDTTDSIFVVKI